MQQVRLLISGILAVAFSVLSIGISKDSSKGFTSEEDIDLMTDQLRDISYRSGNRKENFSAFGLWDEEVERALELAKEAEKYKSTLIRNIEQISDSDIAIDAFCGHGSELRPRYAVLRYAVHIRGDKRVPMEMKRIKFKPQDWVDGLALPDIYADIELRKDPFPDSTVMLFAAILTNEEELLMDRKPPFGRGYDWSWKKVKREYPDIDEAVMLYLANMHLMVEIAQGPDGICD